MYITASAYWRTLLPMWRLWPQDTPQVSDGWGTGRSLYKHCWWWLDKLQNAPAPENDPKKYQFYLQMLGRQIFLERGPASPGASPFTDEERQRSLSPFIFPCIARASFQFHVLQKMERKWKTQALSTMQGRTRSMMLAATTPPNEQWARIQPLKGRCFLCMSQSHQSFQEPAVPGRHCRSCCFLDCTTVLHLQGNANKD